MPTTLRPRPISTADLTFVKSDIERVLVAEESTLRAPQRVYPDACDVGYTVVSHHTGREVIYVEWQEVRDVDRDLLYTVFLPANLAERNTLPALHVLND